jgi:hypothetical protein
MVHTEIVHRGADVQFRMHMFKDMFVYICTQRKIERERDPPSTLDRVKCCQDTFCHEKRLQIPNKIILSESLFWQSKNTNPAL